MSSPLRLVVKDAIDIAGAVTSAGCRAVADTALPAANDAACLAGFRDAGAVIIGKATLDELCITASGRNDWLGCPPNPLDPDRVVGGSSSGSAVAVANGAADIALGSDTGGSIRVPAACCGVVGLKTTWGRVPLGGVWPTAPTFDTVGPLARDVAGVVRAMELLAPSWQPSPPAPRVGRLHVDGTDAAIDSAVDSAIDDALRSSGFDVSQVRLAEWESTAACFDTIFLAELHQHHHALLGQPGVGAHVNRALRAGAEITSTQYSQALTARQLWIERLDAEFTEVDVIALPTLVAAPPKLAAARGFPLTLLTAPLNVAGVPAISLPVTGSTGSPVPPSLQLFGPPGSEELLCATAAVVEASIR